jgi:hypothetical protein
VITAQPLCLSNGETSCRSRRCRIYLHKYPLRRMEHHERNLESRRAHLPVVSVNREDTLDAHMTRGTGFYCNEPCRKDVVQCARSLRKPILIGMARVSIESGQGVSDPRVQCDGGEYVLIGTSTCAHNAAAAGCVVHKAQAVALLVSHSASPQSPSRVLALPRFALNLHTVAYTHTSLSNNMFSRAALYFAFFALFASRE